MLSLTAVFKTYIPFRSPTYKANTSVIEAVFLDLHLSISNDIVSTKIYDNVATLILKLLDCDVPRSTFYGVYLSTRSFC